jgi:Protein kinase domain
VPAVLTTITCASCKSANPVGSTMCHTCGSSLVATNTPLAFGTTLKQGQYRLLEVLGQGGFGITYNAIRTANSQSCAVKEFFPDVGVTRSPDGQVTPSASSEEEFRQGKLGFRDEATRLSSFQNNSIVSVIETFEEHNTAYLVLELLEGETLEQCIASGQLLTEARAIMLLKPLLEALQEIHSRRFLHRDIKPSNIVLTGERPELIDFGSAIAFKPGQTINVSALVLTPDYAALEQYATHAKLGPYTDLYALAATFYEAITGVKPPPSLERANGAKLVPIRDLQPSISEGFAAILEKALSLPVADRISSASEMLKLIKKVETDGQITTFSQLFDLPFIFTKWLQRRIKSAVAAPITKIERADFLKWYTLNVFVYLSILFMPFLATGQLLTLYVSPSMLYDSSFSFILHQICLYLIFGLMPWTRKYVIRAKYIRLLWIPVILFFSSPIWIGFSVVFSGLSFVQPFQIVSSLAVDAIILCILY